MISVRQKDSRLFLFANEILGEWLPNEIQKPAAQVHIQEGYPKEGQDRQQAHGGDVPAHGVSTWASIHSYH